MSKHTPGPWILCDAGLSPYIKIRKLESKGYPIAKVMRENKFIKESSNANAKLIASAPDLLEALQGLYEFVSTNAVSVPDEKYHLVTNAACAIEKAEGRS